MQNEAHFQRQNIMSGAVTQAAKSTAIARDETVQRLTRIWQDILGVESIEPNQNYFDLGGDSSLAVQLFSRIETDFQVHLPLATLFDAPTIAELAQVLRREVQSLTWSPLVAIQPSGTRPPFFCVHGAGGNVFIYRDLSRHLGNDQPFYGLQSQGLDGTSPPLTTIEDMAALYVKEIQIISPHGPYLLGGYCMGGTVAFEVAQQLTARGEEIGLLALFDTMNWSCISNSSPWSKSYHVVQQLTFHMANFLCLNSRGMFRFFCEKLQDLRERMPVWFGMMLTKSDPAHSRMTMARTRALGRLWKLNDRACVAYVAQPFPGRVTDFRPRKQYRQYDNAEAKWDALARRGQDVVVLPVYPAGMLVEPFVKHLATELEKCIDSAIAQSIAG